MKKLLVMLLCLWAAGIGVSGCKDNGTGTTTNPTMTFKAGDKFTYDYYVRDSNNVNDPKSKLVRVWVVLKTDTTYDGKTSVTKFQQTTYSADGVTPQGNKDTVYLSALANGEVFFYDLVGLETRPQVKAMLPAYPDSSIAALKIAKVWVKLSDTKSTGATKWISAVPTTFPFTYATYSIVVTVGMSGSHVGTQSITTASGKTYASAVHTNHTLNIQAAASGVTALNDSTYVRCDVDNTDGLIRLYSDSKKIIPTLLLGPQQVPGSYMELKAVVRQ